jgi:hypothetical protein
MGVGGLAPLSERNAPGASSGLAFLSPQAAAAEILRVRDVEQVLLSINECTLGSLKADICGIFLREGDELVMRCCVDLLASQWVGAAVLRPADEPETRLARPDR